MQLVFIKKYKWLAVLSLVLVLVLPFPNSVLAIGNPDSITIGEVAVFRGVEETGDQLYYCRYDLSYSVEPTENAEDTFLMAIYDTDGTTLLYTRPLNYYQHNIISIYLSASDALTWGSAYKIKIVGNPAIFALTEGVNMRTWTLSGGDYREFTSMGTYLIGQASILETDWGIDLLTSGNLLNTQGSIVFRDAIPGLNNIIPSIFSTTTSYFTTTNTTFTEDYAEETAARIGTMNAAFADLGEWLGISGGWTSLLASSIFAIMVSSVIYATTRRPEIGFVSMFGVFSVCTLMGWVALQLFVIIFIFIGIVFGILWWIGRMG